MTLWLLVIPPLLLLLRRRRKSRKAAKVVLSPLAGLDTGVRSPYRSPRGVKFHRGF